jgi:hypothetical protein
MVIYVYIYTYIIYYDNGTALPSWAKGTDLTSFRKPWPILFAIHRDENGWFVMPPRLFIGDLGSIPSTNLVFQGFRCQVSLPEGTIPFICRMSTRYQYHPIPRFIAVIYEVMCSTSCYIQRRWLRIWTNLFDGQPVSKITIHLPPLVLADTCQHHVICVVVGFVIPRCGSCTCFCPFI